MHQSLLLEEKVSAQLTDEVVCEFALMQQKISVLPAHLISQKSEIFDSFPSRGSLCLLCDKLDFVDKLPGVVYNHRKCIRQFVTILSLNKTRDYGGRIESVFLMGADCVHFLFVRNRYETNP